MVSVSQVRGFSPTYTFVDTDNNDTRVSSLVYDAVGDRTEWSFAYRTDLPGLDAKAYRFDPLAVFSYQKVEVVDLYGLLASFDWTNPTGDTVYTAQN